MVYNTKTKKILLEYFNKNSNVWVSVEQIIYDESICVKRSTLYRLLSDMVEAGVILKEYSIEKVCNLYKINKEDCHEHFHLKCIDCGKYVHIDDKETDNLITQIGKKNEFVINRGKTVLYGMCEECRTKK